MRTLITATASDGRSSMVNRRYSIKAPGRTVLVVLEFIIIFSIFHFLS